MDAERANIGKITLASLVGTTIEFYDLYLFGTAAALVFATFFPKSARQRQIEGLVAGFAVPSRVRTIVDAPLAAAEFRVAA